MPELADAWIGRTIGGCRVHGLIGRGGMGTVYLASQDRLEAWVALKVIRHGTGPQEAAVGRFEREAKAIAALRGKTPHVVQVYDYGWDREAAGYYITMEFVDGESLEGIRRRLGRLAPAVAVAAVIQAARALDVAHRLDLVHRDIKPDNLLLSADGTVKVADFGLVRRVDGSDGMTATGQALGTATFMAPEQAMGDHVDHRADLYSLGATLFALITGRPPHDVGGGAALFEALMHLATTPPPELEIEGDPVDPELNAISKRLLAKRPEERYGSAAEVVEALEAWAASHGGLGDLSGLAQARELPAPVPAAAPDPFADTRERPGTPSPESEAAIDLMIPTGAAGPSGSQGGRSLTSIVALLVALGAPTGIAIWAASGDQPPVGPDPNAAVSRTATPPGTAAPPPPATAVSPPGPSTEAQISANLTKVAKLMDEGDLPTAKAVLEATYKIDPHDPRLDPVRKRLKEAEAAAAETARRRKAFESFMVPARAEQAKATTANHWRAVLKLAQKAEGTAPDEASRKDAATLKQLAGDHLTWDTARQLEQDGKRAEALKAAREAFAGGNAPPELQALRNRLAAALARWEAAQKAAATAGGDEALAALWEAAVPDAPTPADAKTAKELAQAARSRDQARTAFRDALAAQSLPPEEGWTVDELRKRIEECETLAAALPENEQEEARNKLQPLRRLVALHVALDRADEFIKAGNGADARAVLESFLAAEFAEHVRALQLWKRAMDLERSMTIDLGDGVTLVVIRVRGPRGGERYWMGRTEVTHGQWMRLDQNNPSEFDENFTGGKRGPVENLTWAEASAWCEKLNAALSPLQRRFWIAELPTERRWKHAARDEMPGRDNPRGLRGRVPDAVAWHRGNSGTKKQPVAGRKPNFLGLHDMLGNVWELCSDRTTSADGQPAHVTCGGSYLTPASEIGADAVKVLAVKGRALHTGFRVMLSER